MSRFLVTGGLGFIGHCVVRRLLDHQHEVAVADTQTTYGIIPQSELAGIMADRKSRVPEIDLVTHGIDVADAASVDWMMRHYRPDTIIHLASLPRQKVVNANPVLGADVMIRGTINLLEAARQHAVSRFVYVSSSMVYGDFEDHVLEDVACRPQGQYAIMKLAGEDLVRDYGRRTGMEWVIVRPSAVYGPRDVEDRVMARFMLAAMRGQVLRVKGPEERLDFTYVDDCADGIVRAATRLMARNNTYNITRGQSVSLLQAAQTIVDMIGQGTIELEARDDQFPSRGTLNIDRARTILGFDPQTDLAQGLRTYHDWLTDSVYWRTKTV